MSETAEQLHRGVFDPWCPKCGEPCELKEGSWCECGEIACEPLYTREPSLKPDRLKWGGSSWVLDRAMILSTDAAALIRDPISTAMARDSTGDDERDWQARASWRVQLLRALASPDPTLALVGLRHRWLDQQEQTDG